MRIGLLHADTLLGRELAMRLGAALPEADLHLFTLDPEVKRSGEYGRKETHLVPTRTQRGEQPQG